MIPLVMASFGFLSIAATLALSNSLFTQVHIRHHLAVKNGDVADYGSEVLALNSFFRSQCDPLAEPGTFPYNSNASLAKVSTPALNQLYYKFDHSNSVNFYCGKAQKSGSAKKREICFGGPRPPKLGNLDDTYDEDGVFTITVGHGSTSGYSSIVTVQPDGKILAAGTAMMGSESTGVLVRMNPNGGLDPSFADNGIYVSPLSPQNFRETFRGLALQNDGKILVTAGFSKVGLTNLVEVIRLLPNGEPDASFGGGQHFLLDLDPSYDVQGRFLSNDFVGGEFYVIPQSDGKILVLVGNAIRLNEDGTFDLTFGTAGVVSVVQNPAVSVSLQFGRVQSDGTIVLFAFGRTTPQGREPLLVKLQPDGMLDTSFGEDGIASLLPLPLQYSQMRFRPLDLEVQSDGRILIGGTLYLSTASRYYLAVARRNSDGTVDTGFDGDGFNHIAFGCSHQTQFRDMLVRSDGRIDIVGVVIRPASNGFSMHELAIARMLSDGLFEPASGNGNGQELIRMQPGIVPSRAALQDDGKVVVVGSPVDPYALGQFTIPTFRYAP